MNASNKALIAGIARAAIFRDFSKAFHEAMGLPLTITADETWGLPLHGDRNESPFCSLMAGPNKTCGACLQAQDRLQKTAGEERATEPCFSGLCDSAVPLKMGSRLIGFLRTGQVFLKKPTEDDFQRTKEQVVRMEIAVDTKELHDAYFATRVLSPEQYQGALSLLQIFAGQLGALINQIVVMDDSAEDPQIARAKEFIGENLSENCSLADAARFAHVSTFYFCKKFRKATGLTFTEYVARLRTEKAKERLLNPHVRISEVAFEVGFQSLSQFNRCFRRLAGQSPSDYRRNLVGRTGTVSPPTLLPDRLRLLRVKRQPPILHSHEPTNDHEYDRRLVHTEP